MNFNFVVSIALRYFSAKKNNKFVSFISMFSLLGVTLGVAALIIVMSVMKGFHLELTKNIIGLGGDINISPIAAEGQIVEYQTLVQELKKVPVIEKVIPQLYLKALVLSGSNSAGVNVRGLDSGGMQQKSQLINNIVLGDISDAQKDFKIAIGQELAISLGVTIGNEVTLICPNAISTMLGSIPRMKKFKVAAIFKSGMYDYDAATIIMPLLTAQKLFAYNQAVNLIEIYSKDPDSAYKNATLIRDYAHSNYYINTWYDNNLQLLNALDIERVAMFTILSLIIIVAAFNIISSLFMLVNEKKKDIAILRTMGASKKQIMLIFVLNGSLVGVIGTILGIILGVGFTKNIENIRQFLERASGTKIFEPAIYFFYHLPAKIEIFNIIMIAGITIVLTTITAFYPAAKATNIDPAEALRNE